MGGDPREEHIEWAAAMLEAGGVSPDEQDGERIAEYAARARGRLGLGREESVRLVHEALLYMKLKASDSADPLQEGDRFGAGFS